MTTATQAQTRSAKPAGPAAELKATVARPAGAAHPPAWMAAWANRPPAGLFGPLLPLQAKRTVNAPGEAYEQEADRVAAPVMRGPDPAPTLHRKCACGGEAGPDGECAACRARRLGLQRRAARQVPPAVAPPIVHTVLRSPGRPLDPATRAFMEPRFGQDFGAVRVHTGGQAAESARAVAALAYTVGRDVVFGAGQYAPGTGAGQQLLAHELAHVVQQEGSAGRGGAPPLHRKLPINTPGDADEQEADRVAAQVMRMPDPGRPGQGPVQQSGTWASGSLTRGPLRLARAPLDLTRLDTELFWGDPLTQTSGQIGYGATRGPRQDAPTEDRVPDMAIEAFVYPNNTVTRPGSPAPGGGPPAAGATGGGSGLPPTPGADDVPAGEAAPSTPSPRTVAGQPGRSDWRFARNGLLVPARRALVIGGVHGDERGPLALVRQLQSELANATSPLARDFDTILIPVMNPGGVADQTRENRRGVDLNRNFPGLAGFPSLPAGQTAPPEQPEVTAVRRVIEILKPDRILALHAIGSAGGGGAYADPVEDRVARNLACRMALRMRGTQAPSGSWSGASNVAGNQVANDVCNTRYPETSAVSVTTQQSSLGSWASAPPGAGGQGIPVITHEVAGKQPLPATGTGRSVETIMPGIREFLLDNEHQPSEADALLHNAVSNAFLTGQSTAAADIRRRTAIEAIVTARFNDMDAYYRSVWLPNQPAAVRATLPARLTRVSGFRSFADQSRITGGALAQQALFQATSSDADIRQAILNVMQTISLPGFSRHHWGTEIDVVSATRTDWQGTGRFVPLIPFLDNEAGRFGFFHPYAAARPSATLPHYEDEPWHLSYWPIANVLQQEWANRITGTVLTSLIADTARAIHGSIPVARIASILGGMGLTNFQTNVAPSP